MKKEHPHAQVLRWIADGETVEARYESAWAPLKHFKDQVMAQLVCGCATRFEFRFKPKTITVGDREIEAPIKSGPGHFISDTGMALDWMGDHRDHPAYMDLQKQGRVFATEAAARAAQEAITALLTKEPS